MAYKKRDSEHDLFHLKSGETAQRILSSPHTHNPDSKNKHQNLQQMAYLVNNSNKKEKGWYFYIRHKLQRQYFNPRS